MDRDVYARSDVQQYLGDHFVTIRVNAESNAAAHYLGESTTLSQLAGRFGVDGYPTTIFLTAGGDHLANMPGYFPADRFLLLLNYVGDGALARGVPFEDFAKSKGVALDP
jgi:thioredoxin-related protein